MSLADEKSLKSMSWYSFRSTVNSTRNGKKCRNAIGLCLTVLTENLVMQLVSAKFAHGFWLGGGLTDLLQQLEVDENLM
jgi:hypothetical protein